MEIISTMNHGYAMRNNREIASNRRCVCFFLGLSKNDQYKPQIIHLFLTGKNGEESLHGNTGTYQVVSSRKTHGVEKTAYSI